MSTEPFVAQWGILGCGWISSEFVKDVCRPMSSRNVTDVSHAIAAVGSRDISKARQFIQDYAPRGGSAQQDGLIDFAPEACGNYKAVVDHPNVNIVYVGTMNVSHYEDAKLALEGGKHCLLEKARRPSPDAEDPATLNAAEWKHLVSIAQAKKVFLMEAVWTRFNPCMLAVQKAVFDGEIGDVRCVYSDLSMDAFGKRPDSHRVLSAELAGGALLDLGPYPMLWSLMILYRHPKNNMSPPENIGSTMLRHQQTGVDLATSWGMPFPKINAMAFCSATLLNETPEENVTRIVGSAGEIIVQGMTSRPLKYIVRKLVHPEKEDRVFHPDEVHDHTFEGFGLYWEADAVARCLRDGLLECPEMTHAETSLAMGIFDKLRKDGGYRYVDGLEKVKA